MANPLGQTWAVVLAGGEGARLRELVRALHGSDVPKQFAMIEEGRSMLQATLFRARLLVPESRTIAVVASERRDLAREQLRDCPEVELLLQPRNLGSAPGLLLPLARILARDPDALVVVLPSDHYVKHVRTFVNSLDRAKRAASESGEIILLGATPDAPESEYGWIVRAAQDDWKGARVQSFEEKPRGDRALELFQNGALWNTFIMVAKARTLWAAARRQLPAQAALLEAYRDSVDTELESKWLTRAYGQMQPADFSRDVLQKTADLRVLPLGPCGWSDWGSPRRVLASLEGTAARLRLTERLHRVSHPPTSAGLAALALG
jgi:mannose-1-phosphate guanylyltransferase